MPIDLSTALQHICYNSLKATVVHNSLYSSQCFDFTKMLLKRPYGSIREKLQVIKSLQNESQYGAVSFSPQKHTKSRVLPASPRWFFSLICQNSSCFHSPAFS